MHGGISKYFTSFEDLAALPKPTDIPEEGLVCDLLWNDPDSDVEDWADNSRGCGYVFGRL